MVIFLGNKMEKLAMRKTVFLELALVLTLWLPDYYLQGNIKSILYSTSKTYSHHFNSFLLTKDVEFNVAFKIINMT
jgi:hypothetical protein